MIKGRHTNYSFDYYYMETLKRLPNANKEWNDQSIGNGSKTNLMVPYIVEKIPHKNIHTKLWSRSCELTMSFIYNAQPKWLKRSFLKIIGAYGGNNRPQRDLFLPTSCCEDKAHILEYRNLIITCSALTVEVILKFSTTKEGSDGSLSNATRKLPNHEYINGILDHAMVFPTPNNSKKS